MDLSFETIDKEKSSVLLKITVNRSEIKKEYDELLNKVQKDAQIAGFRKGKVPTSILESKYKKGFLADVSTNIIDNAVKEVLEKVEKKPIAFSQPKLENYELPELESDYTFELTYDVFPAFKFGEYKGFEVVKNDVTITDKDIEKELERHLRDMATIEPKEGIIEDNDMVMLDYTVYLNDEEFFHKEGEHVYIGKDYDLFKLGQDIKGLKKDDIKEFEKTFGEAEVEKIKNKTFKIKLTVKEVKNEIRPELTDDIAHQINEKCNTVVELKELIKKDLIEFIDTTIKNRCVDKVFDHLIESFEGEIPESMIAEQQNSSYKEFVRRMGGNEKKVENYLKMENQTVEGYKEKIKDSSIKELKRGLILQEIVKNENIKADEEEIKKHIEPFAAQYKMNTDEFIKMYKDAGRLEMLANEIELKKGIDHIYDNLKLKKGKKLSFEELFKSEENEESDSK